MRDELAGVLDELAARFGSTGAALWESLVRHEIATAWFAVSAVVVMVFVAALLVVVGYAKDEEDAVFGGFVVGIIALVVGLVAGSYAIPALVAPEAAVIKGLLP